MRTCLHRTAGMRPSQHSTPRSYGECVAAGGAVAAATTLAPAFCVLRFDSPSTDYSQCRAAGGHQFTWDQWCPGAVGTRGGDACQVFYLQNDCPTGQAPAGYSWTPPPCP